MQSTSLILNTCSSDMKIFLSRAHARRPEKQINEAHTKQEWKGKRAKIKKYSAVAVTVIVTVTGIYLKWRRSFMCMRLAISHHNVCIDKYS